MNFSYRIRKMSKLPLGEMATRDVKILSSFLVSEIALQELELLLSQVTQRRFQVV